MRALSAYRARNLNLTQLCQRFSFLQPYLFAHFTFCPNSLGLALSIGTIDTNRHTPQTQPRHRALQLRRRTLRPAKKAEPARAKAIAKVKGYRQSWGHHRLRTPTIGELMGMLAKPLNRVLFLVCVLITGALAGSFVWAFFFCMDISIEFAWHTLPEAFGATIGNALPGMTPGHFGIVAWPLIMCLGGGLVIGLYDKHVGFAPEELTEVMGKVKKPC